MFLICSPDPWHKQRMRTVQHRDKMNISNEVEHDDSFCDKGNSNIDLI